MLPCLTILQIWPFAAGLAQDGDRHSRLRQEFSNLDAVAFKIGLQLFRTGEMHRLPAGFLRAVHIGNRIVDEDAGLRIEAEGLACSL